MVARTSTRAAKPARCLSPPVHRARDNAAAMQLEPDDRQGAPADTPPTEQVSRGSGIARVTGTLIVRNRKAGPVWEMKARNRRGGQVKRTLGPVADWPRKKAEDALRDWLTDLGRLPAEGDAVTFEYAAKAWLRYIETDRQRAASTVTDYRNTMNAYLIPHFKGRSLGDISVNDVDALRSELLGKLSPRTTQKALVLVHGIFKLAQRRDWTPTNPAAHAERVRVKARAEFAVLSPVEVQAVANSTASDQDAALILVAAFTGLRMGELRALRWRDVDFANRIVHVRRSYTGTGEGPPKSGAARSVPLIDQAAAAPRPAQPAGYLHRPSRSGVPGGVRPATERQADAKRAVRLDDRGEDRPRSWDGQAVRVPRPQAHVWDARGPGVLAVGRQGAPTWVTRTSRRP